MNVAPLHIPARSSPQRGIEYGGEPARQGIGVDRDVSPALQRFRNGQVGLSYIPPGAPANNGYIGSFNNRLRKECLNRNDWNTLFEARVTTETAVVEKVSDDDDDHGHGHHHHH